MIFYLFQKSKNELSEAKHSLLKFVSLNRLTAVNSEQLPDVDYI
jgi:hypothetical protein